MCQIKEENIYNFVKCESYKSKAVFYEDIFENDADVRFSVAKMQERNNKFETQNRVGQDSIPAPDTPDYYLE